MAMSLGSHGRHRADINMTPMIDVLLVLIIIFMVMTPTTPRGLNALLPQPPQASPPYTPPSHDIVVTVNGDGTVSLNQEPVLLAELSGRLVTLFRNHPNHVIFVRGQKGLEFQPVAEVIDIARGVGLDRVALMTQ
jgi:biopolymer transport protein ExbD